MQPESYQSLIGYDTRKFQFPLKSQGINFGDSKNDKRLQLADIIASTTNFWLNGQVSAPRNQEFWDAIDKLDISQFIINGISPIPPDPELTIQALGINSNDSDIDAVDFITDFLERENK